MSRSSFGRSGKQKDRFVMAVFGVDEIVIKVRSGDNPR